MVHVLANIVKVVVFASSADTLLRVGSAAELCHWVGRIDGVEEDWLELRDDDSDAIKARKSHAKSICSPVARGEHRT